MADVPPSEPAPQQFRPPMFMPPPMHFMPRPPMPGPPHMIPMQKIMEEPLLAKNPTLYIQNLNERVKIPDLKNALYQLVSTNAAQHGAEVVEVHAKRNIRARGQAFVVFNDEDAAEAALQSLRGHMFFGKPLRINYAKKESDVTKKMRGTFEESEKTSRETKRVQELSKRS